MKLESTLPGALGAVLCLAPSFAALPEDLELERVSLQSSGMEGNERSALPAISADGRFVAFDSWSDDLVPGDTNFSKDVFVHDRLTGTTTRVSVGTGGGQGNHNSEDPGISADGRFVVFTSRASNLVANDTNLQMDVFLHDLTLGETTRVSLGEGLPGAQASNFSYNGRISGDGRFVVFSSAATNVVSGDLNGQLDVFRRELATGTNTLVSVSNLGDQGDMGSWQPSVSADGSVVVFQSTATNFAPVDTNGHLDVFVRDLVAGTTTRVSESTQGTQANSYSQFADVSADGRFVAFESRATSLVPNDVNLVDDVFLHDRQSGVTSIVSVHTDGTRGNSLSQRPALSADGRFVAFQSWASSLAPRDNNSVIDIFVHDTLPGVTRLVSLDTAGQQTSNHSFEPAITADGKFVVFQSDAANLVPGDTNGWGDIFVKDCLGSAAVALRTAGANPASYTASVPTLGQVWDVDVDLTTTGHASALVIGKLASTNVPLSSGAVLLVTGPRVFQLGPLPGPVASWSLPLPDDTSLVGIRLYTQAVHLGGAPFALSNAQDLCIGY